MSTMVKIIGRPKFSFWFESLPSVNTHYNMHFRPRSIATAEWRYEAKRKALSAILKGMHLDRPVITGRAFVLVNVYPPHEEISDIHNVHTKALLDGFTDAGIWGDDEWAFVPLFAYRWAGFGTNIPGRNKGRQTRIDIYELGDFSINGDVQRMPKGRTRL